MEYLKKLVQKNKKNQKFMNKKFYFANIALCGLVLGLVIMYFLQVNTIVYKGYAIRDAETKISQLNTEYKQLELEVINLQSIQSLTERAEKLGMVPSEASEFVQITSQQVAQR